MPQRFFKSTASTGNAIRLPEDHIDITFKLERVLPTRRLDDREMHYGIGFENMLKCLDYTTYTEEEVRQKYILHPQLVEKQTKQKCINL